MSRQKYITPQTRLPQLPMQRQCIEKKEKKKKHHPANMPSSFTHAASVYRKKRKKRKNITPQTCLPHLPMQRQCIGKKKKKRKKSPRKHAFLSYPCSISV